MTWIGGTPSLAVGAGNPEALKYGRLWEQYPQYREVAPGEEWARVFLAQANPPHGAEVLDLGCGTGRGGMALYHEGSTLRVTMLDFIRTSLDDAVRAAIEQDPARLRFVKADLETGPLPVAAPYAFCTDVLEHVPPDRVDRVLGNILLAAQFCFFSIATVPDTFSAAFGEALHLSVHPLAWWIDKFRAADCTILWSQETADTALLYVTAWRTGDELVESGVINCGLEQVRANVRVNVAGGWQQAEPRPQNDEEVMIVGGGPSAEGYVEEIRAYRQQGVGLVTLNGAYTWALAHGIEPTGTVVVDARAFNARFTKPVLPRCKYFLASQCDPSVFEGLPPERTWIFHTMTEAIEDILREVYPIAYTIPGGSTVLLRAIPLLRTLGFSRFILYGCDSCYQPVWRLLGPGGEYYGSPRPLEYGDLEAALQGRRELVSDGADAGLVVTQTLAHHAYAQPENDGARMINVTMGGRVFQCAPWQAAQAHEFLDLIKGIGDEVQLDIRGDGLLSWTLEVAARAADAQGLTDEDGGDETGAASEAMTVPTYERKGNKA